MSQVPPPKLVHPVRSPRVPVWVVVMGVFLLLVVVVGVGMLYVVSLSESDPAPLKGSGPPKVVRKLADGWARYYFSDLALEMDMPTPPRPAKHEWDEADRVMWKAASVYEAEESLVSLTVLGTQERFSLDWTAKDAAETELDGLQAAADMKVLSKRPEPIMIGNWKGARNRVEYKQDGGTLCLESYHFVGRLCYNFQFVYWTEDRARGQVRVKKILDSIRRTPVKLTRLPSG
jgi:hypothetical protein